MEERLHDPLLLMKLHRPRLSRDLVARPRLLDQLRSPANLVLVIAPAGYGKTSLVGTWLESIPMPSAWLALDDSDNDFTTFVHYLIAAIQTRFPLVGGKTTALIQAAVSAPVAAVSKNLINELSTIDQDFILVLDDYHLIHNSSIHKLLSDILRYPPAALHLVLIARNDPALPLPGLRGRGLVNELRAADLSFTLDETTRFFREVLRIELSDQDISTLKEKTEGWPVSLRLAAIQFRQSSSTGMIEASQRAGNRYLIDYLVSEVSAQIPAEVKDFLLRTAILDELSAPLCETVLNSGSRPGEAQKTLDWLVESALFTTPVPHAPGWYRYHHVFKQFLLRELELTLPADEIASLHLRASPWYEARGMLEKAISHASAAGDPKAAVGILLRNRLELSNSDDWHRMEQLLRLFPRNIIEAQGELKLAEAAVLLFQAQHARARAAFDAAESVMLKSRLRQGDVDRLQGEIASGRAAIAYWAGDLAQSASLAELALQTLPLQWRQLRLQARLFLSMCLQARGELDRALETLQDPDEADFSPRSTARRLIQTCFVDWLAADLAGMDRAAHATLQRYKDDEASNQAYSWANHFLGIVQYQRNDLEKAEGYFSPLLAHPERVHTLCFTSSSAALALVRQHRGQPERALELAETLLSFALDTGNALAAETGEALKAELAMRQGNLKEAARWAERYELRERSLLPHFYAPPVTYVQVLIGQNTPASRRKAARTLARLRKAFAADHQTRWLISVLGLEAILHSSQGYDDRALAALEKAITLAEPGGHIRLFLDLGDPLKPLLTRLRQQGAPAAYLDRLLSAFELAEDPLGARKVARGRAQSSVQLGYGLTDREMEVLRLLEKRYSDKEIAEILVISKETVHSHLAHLSDKLDVRGRRAIVRAAEELGLFA